MRSRVASAVFPERPGVYIVYREGADRPLYVGVAATQTLNKRWRRQHLRPRAGGSALRRSLGLYLGLVERKLKNSDGRYYPPDVEAAITDFLISCEVELISASSPDAADDLEVEVRGRLFPELNISRARRRRRPA